MICITVSPAFHTPRGGQPRDAGGMLSIPIVLWVNAFLQFLEGLSIPDNFDFLPKKTLARDQIWGLKYRKNAEWLN